MDCPYRDSCVAGGGPWQQLGQEQRLSELVHNAPPHLPPLPPAVTGSLAEIRASVPYVKPPKKEKAVAAAADVEMAAA